jgi:methylthioribose-1-phosphate isomerase
MNPCGAATAAKRGVRTRAKAVLAKARVRASRRSARSAASTRPCHSNPAATVRSTAATASPRAFLPESKLPPAVAWSGDAVSYVDQRALPFDVRVERARTADEIVDAIRTLAVRGAPCIGIFGAYGVALLRQTISDDAAFAAAAARVREARPTAVNLGWAVDRVLASADMLAQAQAIHREQERVDAEIARHGVGLIPDRARIITHCHTGGLATGGTGTALGIILAAQRAKKAPTVFVNETRPLLQGARLTEFELRSAGVATILQIDSAAAVAMAHREVDLVLVGADRIARNGDTANKIGTYALAILASHHGIPFYVVAPRSTFDPSIQSGSEIHIEERDASEVTGFRGTPAARPEAQAFNPAFDVTPRALVTAFVTECGVLRPPFAEAIDEVLRVSR